MEKKRDIICIALIFIGTIFYFFANFQRIAIPGAVFDTLQSELSSSAPYITAFGAIFMYVYAISQLIVGVLIDKFGGFRVILAGGIVLGIGTAVFSLSSDLFIMYFARALIGFGCATFYLGLIRELRNYFSEKNFGLAMAVVLFIGYSGGIAANAPFVLAIKYMNWREIFIIFAFLAIILAVVFGILSKIKKLPSADKSVKLEILPFRIILHKEHNRNLFGFACCNFSITYAIQTVIGKKFLEDFLFCPSDKAAYVLSLMAVTAAVFNIVNASLCRLCHNHRVIFLRIAACLTSLSILFICVCIFFNIKSELIAVMYLVIAANASLSSLIVPVIHQSNTKFVTSSAVSVMNFAFFMMVGFLGTIIGYILNRFDFQKIGEVVIYSPKAYLVIFCLFFAISLFEIYESSRLSRKY